MPGESSRRAQTTGARGVTDRNFLDAAVGYRNDHSAHIAEILTDQWSLVGVVRRRFNPDTSEVETTLVLRIQCDRVEDGVGSRRPDHRRPSGRSRELRADGSRTGTGVLRSRKPGGPVRSWRWRTRTINPSARKKAFVTGSVRQ